MKKSKNSDRESSGAGLSALDEPEKNSLLSAWIQTRPKPEDAVYTLLIASPLGRPIHGLSDLFQRVHGLASPAKSHPARICLDIMSDPPQELGVWVVFQSTDFPIVSRKVASIKAACRMARIAPPKMMVEIWPAGVDESPVGAPRAADPQLVGAPA